MTASTGRGPGNRRLIDGPVAPTLIRFAAPLLITNLLHSLSGTWAAICVSHSLGADALTAVVNANLFLFVMMGAVTGVGMAAGVALGQARGAGNIDELKRVVGSALSFVGLLALLLAATGVFFAPAILDALQMPASARPFALTHLRLTCVSIPSLFLYVLMMMMMRGSGDAKTPFRFTLLWIALGLVLTPLLIDGWWGLPGLGIAGVGVAGTLASSTALLALVASVYRRNLPLALRGPSLKFLVPDWALIALLVRRGLPMALESLIVQGAYFVMLSMVNSYGAATAAAYSGAAQLWGYIQMPAMAIAASVSAMAALNIGAKRWDRVGQIALKGCLISASFTLTAAVLLTAMGDAPLRLFLPQGGEALTTAREINQIVLWGWVAVSVTSCLSAVVRANAAMLAPTLIFAVTMWLFRIPFAKALQPWLGKAALWWSFPVGTVSSALLAYAYYRWGGWRKNPLMLSRSRGADRSG